MKETRHCDNCGNSNWGLIRQRWIGYIFCSTACKAEFLSKRARQIEDLKRWLGYLTPG
jgi:endogenous inhibitor of DNA gyrase (YacG/DUF329 family)